jgi:CHAT domain-containing protein/tetratricopeptide (TPR) repeat protein
VTSLRIVLLAALGVMIPARVAGQAALDLPQSQVTHTVVSVTPVSFAVTLIADQFTLITVDQEGAEVSLSVLRPDGSSGPSIDLFNSGIGRERLVLIATSSGRHVISVEPLGGPPADSRFTIRSTPPRLATAVDRQLGDAQALEVAGRLARENGGRTGREKFLEYSGRALALYQSAGDQEGVAFASYEQGVSHTFLSNWSAAASAFAASARAARQVGDRVHEARSFNAAGAVSLQRGVLEDAEARLLESLAISTALSHSLLQAITLNDLAVTYARGGRYQKALDRYAEALRLRKNRGDAEEGNVLLNIGSLYARIGNLREAAWYHEQAMGVLRFQSNQTRYVGGLIARNAVLLELGSFSEALAGAREALAAALKMADRRYELYAHQQLVIALTGLDQLIEARAAFVNGQRLITAAESSAPAAALLGAGALLEHRSGELVAALALADQALAMFPAVVDDRLEAALHFRAAESLAGLDRLAEARRRIGRVLRIVEDAENIAAVSSTTFLGRAKDYFDLAILIESKLFPAAPERAFAFAQRAKSRALRDGLAQQSRTLSVPVPADILNRLRAHERALFDAEILRSAALSTGTRDATGDQRVAALIRERDRIRDEIREISPNHPSTREDVAANVLTLIRNRRDGRTSYVEYWLGRRVACAWIVDATGIRSVSLPASSNKIAELAKGVVAVMSTSDTAASLAELDQIVGAPIRRLARGRRIIAASDGPLNLLPLSLVLTRGASAPVELIQVPSLAAMALVHGPPGRKTTGVHVFADPVYRLADPRVLTSAASSSSFVGSRRGPGGNWSDDLGRLRYSRREAEAIARAVEPDRVTVSLDFDASLATLQSEAVAHSRIVHIAAHTRLSPGESAASGLVFSLITADGQPRPGLLRVDEVLALKWSAELVVLSACEVERLVTTDVDGVSDIARAFLLAGARSVMTSYWIVDDEATAVLMARFYQELKRNPDRPAMALQLAQNWMRRDSRWRAPYYWAGFAVVGASH